MKCTRFKSVKNPKPISINDLNEIFDEIRSNKYEEIIKKIQADIDPRKSPLKDKLPCFTPTGVFSHRSIAGLEEYNGIICLDLDAIDDPDHLKDRCKNLNYVYCAFITPSGNGLKVLIKTNATPINYRTVENMVADRFKNETGAERDNHCKDISRIQFVSYDPEIYINENSITLIY